MLIAHTAWPARLISLLWPSLLFLPMIIGGLLVGYWSEARILLFLGAILLAMEGLRQAWHARWSLATIVFDGERLELRCLGRHEERVLGEVQGMRRKEGLGKEILCLDFKDGVSWRLDSWMSQFPAILERLRQRFPDFFPEDAVAEEEEESP